VRQARGHHRGRWFHPLTEFPAAYYDPRGFVAWATEEDYRRSPHLRFGPDPDHVHTLTNRTIADIPGYVRVR
jgi:hypothetical protein